LSIDGVGLGAVAAGSVFLYAGVKGYSIPQAVQFIVQGKSPATLPQTAGITTPTGAPPAGSGSGVSAGGEQGGTAAQNKAIGQRLAAAYGWGSGAEWNALITLWDKESNWNNRAVNPSSGATGIPQALPASKMPKAAQSPTFNAGAQISWGLRYIKQRYGSPSRALAFHRSHNWY
jgi:hypothetical protein